MPTFVWKGQSLGYGSALATSGRPLSLGSLLHHGLCECGTEPGGLCVFVETCEHACVSCTSFWGQIPSFHHILREVSNDSQKLIRTAHHQSHDHPTQLCHSHWSCQGFRRPWTWAWPPSPAVCQDVTLDLLFMATPHLSEAFLGMRGILNARAGARWQDVPVELQTHMCLPCGWRSAIFWPATWMEGWREKEVDEGMGGSRETAGLCPCLPLVQGSTCQAWYRLRPTPASLHLSCPCEHYITGGKEEIPGGDVARSGPGSAFQWSPCLEAGAPKERRMRSLPLPKIKAVNTGRGSAKASVGWWRTSAEVGSRGPSRGEL